MCLLSRPFSKAAPSLPLPANAESDPVVMPATTNMMAPLPPSKTTAKTFTLRAKLEARMAEAKAKIRCMKSRAKAAAKEIKHKLIATAKTPKTKPLTTLQATFRALKPAKSLRALFPASTANDKKTDGCKGKAVKGPSRMLSLHHRMSGLLRRDKSGKDSASADTPLDCDAEAVVVVVRPASEVSPAEVKVPLKSSELGHRFSRAVLSVFVCFNAMPVC
ncbi:hypothetical protein Rsub_13126 [Raphidocelis subcapitata]|uniref:Uncharacterized protein n=1 Tax=Raphidocelis subcapitata TaxID=307507 RepID=A0A2V0PKX1_9CHLO|nr:hypothetical protein Rsub_13126 [Raphidocelis subcapitata]|eukprot:GBG00367.1 hypothetical protein Rsub_13126 [Raphidocelis subcapitata]